MNTRIDGIEYFLPKNVETLNDLQLAHPDWPIEKLAASSGITSRHLSGPDETSCDLGAGAANKLLNRLGVAKSEVDFLISCSQTPDHFLPPNACILQHRLGLSREIGTLDVSVGCSGYVVGLFTAKALIQSGMARKVLLVTSDTISKVVNDQDRALRVLFGDAGAATLLSASDSPGGLGEFVLGTNGSQASRLVVPAGGFRQRCSPATALSEVDEEGSVRSQQDLFMDGPAIFTFAITTIPKALKKLYQKASLDPADVDAFVFHQANEFMLKELAKRCGISGDRLVVSLSDVGNTSSVSIPIALQRHVEAGRIQPGMRLVLAGFGVGLSWAACELTWS
jgi:3-oxoacyl-[acyl-carrier-protein] synthase-3